MKAVLGLEDGTCVVGEGFGKKGVTCGELVFATPYTGYEEALTDPSYKGQVLLFTYPLIGNYGVNADNFQSAGIKAEAMVIRERCDHPSHNLSRRSLDQFLTDENVSGISEVDTRMLTIKTRTLRDDAFGAHRRQRRRRRGLPSRSGVAVPEGHHRPGHLQVLLRDQGRGPAGRGHGLRRQAQDPRQPGPQGRARHRRPGAHQPGAHHGLRAGRDTALQRPRRPAGRRQRHRGHPQAGGTAADLRHLPRPPDRCRWRSGRRPTSSSSATAAPTSRSSTPRRGRSTSPARTTATPSTRKASTARASPSPRPTPTTTRSRP